MKIGDSVTDEFGHSVGTCLAMFSENKASYVNPYLDYVNARTYWNGHVHVVFK